MKSRTIYITVRVDLSVPDSYKLSDSEIAEALKDFVQMRVQLPQASLWEIDNVEICGVNDF